MTRRLVRPIRARAGVACLALTAGVVLAGCSQMSPQTTQLQYAASDGVRAQQGALGVRNLLLVAHDGGDDATVVGTLVNTGQQPLSVTLGTGEPLAQPIEVKANSSLDLTSAGDIVVPIDSKPGLMQSIQISAGTDNIELSAPVLDGTLPEYSTLLPPTASYSATAPGANTEMSPAPTAGAETPAAETPSETETAN